MGEVRINEWINEWTTEPFVKVVEMAIIFLNIFPTLACYKNSLFLWQQWIIKYYSVDNDFKNESQYFWREVIYSIEPERKELI